MIILVIPGSHGDKVPAGTTGCTVISCIEMAVRDYSSDGTAFNAFVYDSFLALVGCTGIVRAQHAAPPPIES